MRGGESQTERERGSEEQMDGQRIIEGGRDCNARKRLLRTPTRYSLRCLILCKQIQQLDETTNNTR